MKLEQRKNRWVVISDDGKQIWIITTDRRIAENFIQNNT